MNVTTNTNLNCATMNFKGNVSANAVKNIIKIDAIEALTKYRKTNISFIDLFKLIKSNVKSDLSVIKAAMKNTHKDSVFDIHFSGVGSESYVVYWNNKIGEYTCGPNFFDNPRHVIRGCAESVQKYDEKLAGYSHSTIKDIAEHAENCQNLTDLRKKAEKLNQFEKEIGIDPTDTTSIIAEAEKRVEQIKQNKKQNKKTLSYYIREIILRELKN